MSVTPPPRLAQFLHAFNALVESDAPESVMIRDGGRLLADLVAQDDWLPAAYAQPDPDRYRQFLLYRDPPRAGSASRFSVVSFVWGPGQYTPIHDHTVWGLIGMLRGCEQSQPYRLGAGGAEPVGAPDVLVPGQVEAVSPTIGDIHAVSNRLKTEVSISIHVYGADIGEVRRSTYTLSGERKMFVSGYSNTDASPAFALPEGA